MSAPVRPRPAGARPAGPAAGRRPTRGSRRRRRSRLLGRALLVALLALLVGGTTFVGGLLAAPFDEKRVPPPPKAVLLLAADGTQIGSIRPIKRRELVPAEAIPDVMRQAIIAAEDERFLEHSGVDPIGISRAFLRDVTGGRQQGGSTLTQQYVKNVYVGNDRTLTRKVKEAAIAVRLEERKTKEEILTDYLNVLFLGNGTYGVQAASRFYFGVDVSDLDFDRVSRPRPVARPWPGRRCWPASPRRPPRGTWSATWAPRRCGSATC
jgi:penicillin-binding protein 1A